MKRGSVMLKNARRQSWRRYPSAIINTQSHSFFKPPQNEQKALSLALAASMCEYLIQKLQEKIQQVQINLLLNFVKEHSNFFIASFEQATTLNIEKNTYSLNQFNSPDTEPMQIPSDLLCNGDGQIQIRKIKRQISIKACFSPQKELRQLQKQYASHKLLPTAKSNKVLGLVPLNSIASEQEICTSNIQTFYRQKFTRESLKNQEENKTQMKYPLLLRKVRQTIKQQYSYDYNGAKIPMVSQISRENHVSKVLKTKYKVPKEKPELRLIKKLNQTIRSQKIPNYIESSRFIDNGHNIRQIKREIEQNSCWMGKLQSLHLISQCQRQK